jgi:hypothetical protein
VKSEQWLRICWSVVPWAMAAAGIAFWLAMAAFLLSAPGQGVDFNNYYAAALALRGNAQANIYDLRVLRQAALAHHAMPPSDLYLYPPVLAVLLLPLTAMPYDAARLLWVGFSLACWLACALLLVDLLRAALQDAPSSAPPAPARAWRQALRHRFIEGADAGLWRFAAAAMLFAALTFMPLAMTVAYGEVNALILLCLLLAAWLARCRRPLAAGMLLGLAAGIKVYPLVLIGYYALRGRWRVVGSALASLAALGALVLLVLGPAGLASTHLLLANGTVTAARACNEALARVPLWLALAFGGTASTLTAGLGVALQVLAGGAFVIGVLAARWRAHAGTVAHVEQIDLYGVAWAMATMILVAPITWAHHDAWLLVPLAVCLGSALRLRGTDERWALYLAAALAAYALTAALLPFGYDHEIPYTLGPYVWGIPLRPLFMLLRPLAATLLWVVSGTLYLRAAGLAARRRPLLASRDARFTPALYVATLVLLLGSLALVVGGEAFLVALVRGG